MPTRPLTPCRHPGCAALVPSGYCELHRRHSAKTVYDQTRRKADPVLARNDKIRSGGNWKKCREINRAQNPLCFDPFKDHGGWPVPMTDTHHILPLATHPHLAYDQSNLVSLCRACHNKIEQMERAQQPTEHLFKRPTN